MKKYFKKLQNVIRGQFLKSKILLQCNFKKKTIKNYDEAIKFLNEKNYDCKTSCIRDNDELKTWNYQPSIIIPAYNCESSVERCIKSVLLQKIKYTYEIIVINDGSTDNTQDVLKKFENIENIHMIEQKK